MILKNYQEIAVNKLINQTFDLLKHKGKKLIFKAPTGSGKTIIMAEYLKKLVSINKNNECYSFIWIAPRQLHLQSRQKLEQYYENTQVLRCLYFEELDDKRIGDNEILFFNWESINRQNDINVYIRENEQEFYLSKVLENTREAGNKIILIIDESHYSTDTENADNLKNLIGAELSIEVSATPVFIDPDSIVSVNIEDAKDEGMIKKSIVLNEDIENSIIEGNIQSELSQNSDELVIELAIKKRKMLSDYYKENNSKVNPLIIIQLPPRIRQVDEDLKNKLIQLLNDKYKITTTNGKLAIYLAEQHENIEEIAFNENETEVLLFKQGIALGWDCPRAQIMVLFREWHNEIFSIQTVGRIMRMPEPEKGHYESEILNHAYVYTNLSNIFLEGEAAKGYITIYKSFRKKIYEPLNLDSYSIKRQREKTRLSPLFTRIFLKLVKMNNLKKKITFQINELNYNIISNWEIVNIDKSVKEGKNTIIYNMTEEELQKYFDNFVSNNLKPFYPEDRSLGRVKDAIYRFFEVELGLKYEFKQNEIIKIVISDQNQQKFIDIIDETKIEYLKEVSTIEREVVKNENWNIPVSIRFNESYQQLKQNKSIMNPCFISNNWKPERKFIEYLDKSNNVKWWYKSGERDSVYFAIPYIYNDSIYLFYVDFLVKFNDGSIGLFDTKSGFTLRDPMTIAKSNALQKYIKSNRKLNIWGGIVTNTDYKNFNGRWVYFKNNVEKFDDKDFSLWFNLDL